MYLHQFQYKSPETVDDLLLLLSKHKDKARILAGGTDIIPNMLNKIYKADYLIDISGIKTLAGIDYKKGKGLKIGAATKLDELEYSKVIKDKYYALHQSAREIGSPQIRAMATLGGNTCNASPAADTPPVLAALGTLVSIVSKKGKREMLLEDFIQGNRITALKPDECLESFQIPDVQPGSVSRFGLVTLRKAVEIDIASIAVNLVIDPKTKKTEDIKIVLGSVAPVPLRAKKAESILIGQTLDDVTIEKAANECANESKPIDDIRASAAYRRHVISVLARRVLNETFNAIK